MSERLREILSHEGITGWRAELVRHTDPARDRYPPLYWLGSANELPPVATKDEFDLERYPDGARLVQHGPLIFRRNDLVDVRDINQTRERFNYPFLVVSQRVRQIFRTHKVRGDFEFEPVVVLE